MENIHLGDLKSGMPGISAIEGANLYENCVVALHNRGHQMPVILVAKGLKTTNYSLIWEDTYNQQLERTYNDLQSVTERAAVGISVILAIKETEYTIIERSRKGTGFDYMLGDKADPLFTPKARLEISGIMKETEGNTISSRFLQKTSQVKKSDCTSLPAYISIVEFSTPKVLFDIKK